MYFKVITENKKLLIVDLKNKSFWLIWEYRMEMALIKLRYKEILHNVKLKDIF